MSTRKTALKFALATGSLLCVVASTRTAAALKPVQAENDVLVLGGTGKIGRAIVENFLSQGNKVTIVGSRDISKVDDVSVKKLLESDKVKYVQLNLNATDEKSAGKLRDLLQSNDITVDAAEDYPIDQNDVASAENRTRRLYTTAMKHGYSVAGGKVWLRIGSPPAEIASREAVPGATAKFEEDIDPALSPDITKNLDHPYFASKLKTARLAKDLSRKDLAAADRFNVRTAAPTYFVGPGSWGPDRELVVKYHSTIKSIGVDHEAREAAKLADAKLNKWYGAPNAAKRMDQAENWHHYADSVEVDTVDASTVGHGASLVVYYGDPGETYQLAGRAASTAKLLNTGLRKAGIPAHELPHTLTPLAYETASAKLIEGDAARALGIPTALASLAFRLPRAMRAQRSDAKMQMLNARAQADGYKGALYERPTEAKLVDAVEKQAVDLIASKKINPNQPKQPKVPGTRAVSSVAQPQTAGQAYKQAAIKVTNAYVRGWSQMARAWGVR